jgi:L-asparaginase
MRFVHLLSCGGTIEKIYSERTGAVVNVEDKIVRYLDRLRLPETEVETTRLMNKDSLEMDDADRQMVLDAVHAKLAERAAPIVITHGTDTMVETGLRLKRALPGLAVPIILTGAMTPLGFENSDGLQNLTESLFAAHILAAGVWLVMHNQAFPIERVRKDRRLSKFVWTDPASA